MHLALLGAVARIHALPLINTTKEHKLHQQMKEHRTFLGLLDTKSVLHAPVPHIESLKAYLEHEFVDKDNLLEGCFSYIVDTGCSCSCSPHKEDFEQLHTLKSPITLKGVLGEVTCTQAGLTTVQAINSLG